MELATGTEIGTRKAIVKARMMTGSYILQIDKHKFNNNSIDPTCPLCKADDETIIHLITTCPILSCIREKHFTIIRDYFEEINITDMDGNI